MPFSVVQNLLKITHGLLTASLYQTRGYKLQLTGIVPGGGLGKLRGIKEEEYFLRQDYKLFKNMKEREENLQKNDIRYYECQNTLDEHPTLIQACESPCSLKQKNPHEEAFFLNDHCDCIRLLKAKMNNQPENKEEIPKIL